MSSSNQLPFPQTSKANVQDPTLTSEELELIEQFDFLPQLYNLINALEHSEDTAHVNQVKELSQKIQQKITNNFNLIENFSGCKLTNEEQLEQLGEKFEKLRKKRAQRENYLNLPIFKNNELLNKLNNNTTGGGN